MRLFLLLTFSIFLSPVFGQVEFLRPFYHVYSLRTDSSQCGTADVANYPLCVQITKSYLAKTKTGEDSVMNHYKGTPYDVEFSTSPGFEANNLLNWEIEYWDSAGGSLKAWVKLPNLPHATGQVIYMGVGNASITSFQGGSAGSVWASQFKIVSHLPDGNTLTAKDFTTNGNNGTITSATATTGNIDGGASFNGSSAYIDYGTSARPTSTITVSLWVNFSTTITNNVRWCSDWSGSASTDRWVFYNAGTTTAGFVLFTTSGTQESDQSIATSTWYYMVGEFDGSHVLLYKNGSSASTNLSGTIHAGDGTFSIRLGKEAAEGGYFLGTEDEYRIRSDVEPQSEITADYNSQVSGSTFLIVKQIY